MNVRSFISRVTQAVLSRYAFRLGLHCVCIRSFSHASAAAPSGQAEDRMLAFAVVGRARTHSGAGHPAAPHDRWRDGCSTSAAAGADAACARSKAHVPRLGPGTAGPPFH